MATKETVQLTYLQLISQDEKTQKTEALQIRAQEASLDVQREIMNLNAQIASKKNDLFGVQRQFPYNVKNEYKVCADIDKLEEALAFAQEIKKVRFSDVSI